MLNNKRLKNGVEQTIESGETLEMSINFAHVMDAIENENEIKMHFIKGLIPLKTATC